MSDVVQDPFFDGGGEGGAALRGRPARMLELVLAFAIAFACALPFLDKAVQQDDWAYLAVSKLIEEHGLFGMLEQETLYQGRPESAAHGMLHGPLWPAVLLLCHQTGEGVLWWGHLASALFLGLLAVGGTALAARLGAPALPTGLALALSPIPLVLAGGLMTDLPMVALFTAAMAMLVRALQEDHARSYLFAGLLGAGAALTRYHGLAILPMFAVTPFLLGRVRWRAFGPLGLAAGAFALWTAASMLARGQADHDRAVGALAEIQDLDRKECLLTAVCAVGGVALGWWVAMLCGLRSLLRAVLRDPLPLAMGIVGLAFGIYCGFDALASRDVDPSGINAWAQWVFLALGGIVLFAFVAPLCDVARLRGGLARWREARGLDVLLALWFLGFFVSAWVTVPFGATRYCLPAMPALFLGLARYSARYLPGAVPWLAAPLTAGLGLVCAFTDERAAAVYPQMAEHVAQRSAEGEAWSQGQTWIWGELGFRWYLERELDLPLVPGGSNAPAPGDRLLKSALCTAASNDGESGTYRLHPELVKRIDSQEVHDYPDDWPVRIHNPYAGAGFYNASAGLLPFAWSTAAHDRLQTWQVKDENLFLANFEAARRTPGPPLVRPGAEPYPARILVERLTPSISIESKLSIYFVLEGELVWDGVPFGADVRRLVLDVCEPGRVHEQSEPGPGSVAEVLINGEVVASQAMDSRRVEGDRRWFPLVVDLERWRGQRVSLGLRARAQAPPADLPEGFDNCVLVGFGEPRLESE